MTEGVVVLDDGSRLGLLLRGSCLGGHARGDSELR
jgi:hypothetical protein